MVRWDPVEGVVSMPCLRTMQYHAMVAASTRSKRTALPDRGGGGIGRCVSEQGVSVGGGVHDKRRADALDPRWAKPWYRIEGEELPV